MAGEIAAPNAPKIVLASTSAYRRQLLGRLGLAFAIAAPQTDETPREGESPAELAARLARAKAVTVAADRPSDLIIGCDQVAARDAVKLGKPGNAAEACRQLEAASGREVVFYTACCIANGHQLYEHVDITRVRFRTLSRPEIIAYVERDKPLDCAGSFKVEALGIALFDAIETTDPTALVGLPLIWVCKALRRCGLTIP